jgi:hypothetical protein
VLLRASIGLAARFRSLTIVASSSVLNSASHTLHVAGDIALSWSR